MKPVSIVCGQAVPMSRADIDTDAIIPQSWLITIERDGLGKGLFANWRYEADGKTLRRDFILNDPRYRDARILVAGPNYGCGSSREHAVWAHLDFGIDAVIAASFGPIFRDNALKNGLLVVEVNPDTAIDLWDQLSEGGKPMTVDLVDQMLTGPNGTKHRFTIDALRREALLQGRDDISATLDHRETIQEFQARDRVRRPWIWPRQQ